MCYFIDYLDQFKHIIIISKKDFYIILDQKIDILCISYDVQIIIIIIKMLSSMTRLFKNVPNATKNVINLNKKMELITVTKSVQIVKNAIKNNIIDLTIDEEKDLITSITKKLNLNKEKKEVKTKILYDELWNTIQKNKNLLQKSENLMKYILNEFGSSEPCNRFDVGNAFEFIMADFLKLCNFKINELPNAKRVDICINNCYKLSIKYSGSGDIKLHNSNNSANKDMSMNDTLLITPSKLYLLSKKNIEEKKLKLKDYLQDRGDGLSLKRSLLKDLENKNFKYSIDINLKVDKKNCKNRLCSKLFYEFVKNEYNSKLTE